MKLYQIRCPKCNNIHFIVTAKILTVIKSISAGTAIINLHPNGRGRRGQIVGGSIRLAPCAEKLPFCITIMSIIPTTVAVTKSATILSLNGNPLPLPLRLCPHFSASIILSVCVILFKSSLRLCQCFISVKTLSEISVLYSKLPLISRFHIPLSAIGALSSLRCLMICGFSLFLY